VVTVSEQVADGNGHSALAVELARLRAENARLLRLLKLTRQEAAPTRTVAVRAIRGTTRTGARRLYA
jgi:hypothetical protein